MATAAAVTWATILARIQELLIDANLDFFVEAQLKTWYDDGAANQHRIVLKNAEDTGRLRQLWGDYIPYFLKASTAANFVAGTNDYAIPTDQLFILAAEIVPTSGDNTECQLMDFKDDWRIKSLPNWRPVPSRPYWALTDDGKARFYFSAGDTTPQDATLKYRFTYIRDVIRTGAGNVDLYDPWNQGPIAFAVAKAFEKQRRDSQPWHAEAIKAAHFILPPKEA